MPAERVRMTVGPGGAERRTQEEIRGLALRWPRDLVDPARRERLAADWIRSREASRAALRGPFARHGLTRALGDALFEARRARRLVRGLEAAQAHLAAQAGGVVRALEGDVGRLGERDRARVRLSRLLLISEDGSSRFMRRIDDLYEEYGFMLEVLLVTCDEFELARVPFGANERARVLLIDHKGACVRVLESLDGFEV